MIVMIKVAMTGLVKAVIIIIACFIAMAIVNLFKPIDFMAIEKFMYYWGLSAGIILGSVLTSMIDYFLYETDN